MPSILCIIWAILCAFSGIKRSTVKTIIKEYEEGGEGGSVLFSTPKDGIGSQGKKSWIAFLVFITHNFRL